MPPATKALLVLLGAKDFSAWGQETSPAFETSARSIRSYLEKTFELTSASVLDLFDSPRLPSELCIEITDFLTKNTEATDLFVCYVGHGSFLEDQQYFLACRATLRDEEHVTGLRVGDLARTLTRRFRNGRIYLVLDCCFAAEAAQSFQSPGEEVVARKLEELPRQGIALLAASSRKDVAKAPAGEQYTMFSGCLLDVLAEGIANAGERFSLRQLGDAVERRIALRYRTESVRPEVHSPRQPTGDLADAAVFPNPAWVPGKPPVPPTPRPEGRWRRSAYLFLVMLALLGVGTLYAFRRPAHLLLEADPAEVELSVDGSAAAHFVSPAPLELSPGPHLLELRKGEFHAIQRVVLHAGESRTASIKLVGPATGWIVLNTIPANLRATLDDEKLEEATPLKAEARVGRHKMTAFLDDKGGASSGGLACWQDVIVTEGQTTELTIDLERPSRKAPAFGPPVEPPHCVGYMIGKLPDFVMPPGSGLLGTTKPSDAAGGSGTTIGLGFLGESDEEIHTVIRPHLKDLKACFGSHPPERADVNFVISRDGSVGSLHGNECIQSVLHALHFNPREKDEHKHYTLFF